MEPAHLFPAKDSLVLDQNLFVKRDYNKKTKHFGLRPVPFTLCNFI